MEYAQIMENIRTTRDFKSTKIQMDLLESIVQAGEKAQEGLGHQVRIYVFEDGERIQRVLSNRAGYHGLFIDAPHYLAVCSKDLPLARQQAAYAAEEMRFKAHALELGTCWVSVPDLAPIRQDMGIHEDLSLVALLALGVPYTGIFRKDIQEVSFRKGVTDLVYLEEWGHVPEWEELELRMLDRVFYLTRLAPSFKNIQPWKFLLSGPSIVLALQKGASEVADTDTGIVRFYFEKACQMQGLRVRLVEETDDTLSQKIPENFQIKAIYRP